MTINFKGLRTMIVGAVIAALGGIQAAEVATIVPESYVGIVMGGIGVVIMVLRLVTNTPVGSSELSPPQA